MTNGLSDIDIRWVSRVNHLARNELHRFGALSTKLSGYNDLDAVGTGFHDEAKHTIASTTYCETLFHLVNNRLALDRWIEPTTLGFGKEQLKGYIY